MWLENNEQEIKKDSLPDWKTEEAYAFKNEADLLKLEFERYAYINDLMIRINADGNVEKWPGSTQFPWYRYQDFLKEHGLSGFENLQKWMTGDAMRMIRMLLESARGKWNEYFKECRRDVIRSIQACANSGNRTPQDKNLMVWKITVPDSAEPKIYYYNIRNNSPKKYLIAMFWHALLYTNDTKDCPIPDLSDLCTDNNILNTYEWAKARLTTLWKSNDFVTKVDWGINKQNFATSSNLTAESINETWWVMSLFWYLDDQWLKTKYNYVIVLPEPKNSGIILKDSKTNEQIGGLITWETTFQKLFGGYRWLFGPMRQNIQSRSQAHMNFLLQSTGNGSMNLTWSTQIISNNKDSFGFMEMFEFIYGIKNNKKHPIYFSIQELKNSNDKWKISQWIELERLISNSDISIYTISWLEKNRDNAKESLFKIFSPLYSLSFLKQFESKNLSPQVDMLLWSVDAQLWAIHTTLWSNRQTDLTGDVEIKYPDEEVKAKLNDSFIAIQLLVTQINTLNITPGAIVDDKLKTRYRKTMAKIFLAMSGVDPVMLDGLDPSKVKEADINIYSAIMKNGWWIHANAFTYYFEEYLNTLDTNQLFELANWYFAISYMTGADEYDAMEKMMLSSMSTLVYTKTSDALLKIYAEKKIARERESNNQIKNNLKVELDTLYNCIVHFYRIISGRKSDTYAIDKFQAEEWYSFSLTNMRDVAKIPLGWPALKYFTNLYNQNEHISNLRDDCLLGTDVALSGLEKLLRVSWSYDNIFKPQNIDGNKDYTGRFANLQNYRIPSDNKDEELRWKAMADIGFETTDIESMTTMPWWQEHFNNKLMEMWFFNLGMDHFKPEWFTIEALIEKAKNWSTDKWAQIMDFYASLTQKQLTELCLFRTLYKEKQFSDYMNNPSQYSQDQLDAEKDKDFIAYMQWLSKKAERFSKEYDALMQWVTVQSYAIWSDKLKTINDAWVALYYNISWNNTSHITPWSVSFGKDSDASIRKQRWYTKTAAIIAGWIAVGLVTFGAGTVAMGTVVGLKAVALALAVWTTTTIYGHATRQEWYVNPDDVYADLGSQFLLNSATAFIGIKYFNPGMGNLVGKNNPAFGTALKYALSDAGIGFWTEIMRQKAIASCTEIKSMDWKQIMTMWGLMLVMSLLSPMVTKLAQKRMQWVDIDSAEIQAAKNGIATIDPEQKAQIIQELKTTLMRNGVSEKSATKTANRMRQDFEKAKNKLKELESGDYAPKKRTWDAWSEGNDAKLDFSDINSPQKARDFIQSLTESEDGLHLLRIFMDSEIDAKAARFPLRKQIADITDDALRYDIAKMLHKAFGGTDKMRESGWRAAIQKAHEIPPTWVNGEYTPEDIMKKLLILRAAVKNGDLTEDGMKAALRFNICAIWHWVEKLIAKLCLCKNPKKKLINYFDWVEYSKEDLRYFSDHVWIDIFEDGRSYAIKTSWNKDETTWKWNNKPIYTRLTSETSDYIWDIFYSKVTDIKVSAVSRSFPEEVYKNLWLSKWWFDTFSVEYSVKTWDKNIKHKLYYVEWNPKGWNASFDLNGEHIDVVVVKPESLRTMRQMYVSMIDKNNWWEWVCVARWSGKSRFSVILPHEVVSFDSTFFKTVDNVWHLLQVAGPYRWVGWKSIFELTGGVRDYFEIAWARMKGIADFINERLSKWNLLYGPAPIKDTTIAWLTVEINKAMRADAEGKMKFVVHYASSTDSSGSFRHEFRIFKIPKERSELKNNELFIPKTSNKLYTDVEYIWWYSVFSRNIQ